MTQALTQARRDLEYLVVGLVTSCVAFCVWVAGVTATASLAVFVVGIPVFIASAVAFRWAADLDRTNTARFVGRPVRGEYRPHGARGWLARLRAVGGDVQTWRDLGWLVVHSTVGFGFGVAALTCVVSVPGIALLPLWYGTLPDGANVGLWEIDTLGGALAAAPLAVPAAGLTVLLLRGMAVAEAGLATALLGPRAQSRAAWPGLALHASIAVPVGLACTLIWALTGAGTSWPRWVWFGLGCGLALHGHAIRHAQAGGDPEARIRLRAELFGLIVLAEVVIWLFTGRGYFWPAWSALGMGLALALQTAWALRHELPWLRERTLVARVDELTRTRSGALDVQAAELRRIERDLHDGAQARLVALSMLMGRAEERLGDQPEVAELVRQARAEAGAAISELRDLARGIAPPVLADRGLAAAVESLAVRADNVTVDVADGRRPPPVVETAAYFVVAEALTNAAKHAPGAPAHVAIKRHRDRLEIVVRDEGPGGANPRGSGLQGLRQRVEALDGSLAIESRPGTGTQVIAELPCAS